MPGILCLLVIVSILIALSQFWTNRVPLNVAVFLMALVMLFGCWPR